MELRIKLSDILKERDMTQKELAEATGIRTAAISEICSNQRRTINRTHLTRIAETLGIREAGDLIEFRT